MTQKHDSKMALEAQIMSVQMVEWLYEMFCEGQSIDMFDVQEKMTELGIISADEADRDDIESGFEGDEGDIIFRKDEEYKKEVKNIRTALSQPDPSGLVKALEKLSDGTYRNTPTAFQCKHAKYGFEDCDVCVSEFATEALAKYKGERS